VVTPAAAADATAMTPGIYKGFFPGASSPGLEATLYLNADGTLQLVNDYLNEEPPFIELGTWSEGEGTVEITITGPEDQPYDAPSVRTLAIEEDRLASADWIGPWLRFDALAQGMEPAYEVDLATKSLDQGF